MSNKRDLFKELEQGIDEATQHQGGKITLRSHDIEKKPLPKISARLIREIREEYHMSRQVFAIKLRVSPRTLEKWEQGLARPNDQAAALLLLVQKYPDTLERLERL